MSTRLRIFPKNISDRSVVNILIGFCLGAIAISIAAHVQAGENWYGWIDSVAQNFGSGMFGSLLTFVLIDIMLERTRKQDAAERQIEERKSTLMRQLGSTVNAEAKRAAEELQAMGWLQDQSLRGARLVGANLEEANLLGSKLQDANLLGATLSKAVLLGVNLEGAILSGADLRAADLSKGQLSRTILSEAQLSEARLWWADLEGADLRNASLQNASLWEANLKGAQLQKAKFTKETTMPDGENWTPQTNLDRFTDQEHQDFWRSSDPMSPAYKRTE